MDCGALTSGPVKDRQVSEPTGNNINPLELSSAVHTTGGGARPIKLNLTERPRPRRKQELGRTDRKGTVERKKRTRAQNRTVREQKRTVEKGKKEGKRGGVREQFRGQM